MEPDPDAARKGAEPPWRPQPASQHPAGAPPPRDRGPSEATAIVVAVVFFAILAFVGASWLAAWIQDQAPPQYPRAMGLSVAKSADGTNWTLTVSSTTSDGTPSSTYLTATDGRGRTLLPLTAFSSLTTANWSANHAVYADANPGNPRVASGDALYLRWISYPPGSFVTILDNAGSLVSIFLE